MKMWTWWMIEMCNIERYVINSNLWWNLYGKHTKEHKAELAASSKRVYDRFAEIRKDIAAAKAVMIWKYYWFSFIMCKLNLEFSAQYVDFLVVV